MDRPIDLPQSSADSRTPKVSVLMPTCNNGEFLADAVESILAQTLEDFEFIIVDDGSTDGSGRMLELYATRDTRIRIIRNQGHRGIVYSLNRGLKACRGVYIARMDGDDIAVPERLARQVAFLEADPGVLALGGALSYMDRRGKDLGVVRRPSWPRSLLAGNPLFHPTVVFRREISERHGLAYQERFRYAEDYFLWLQIARLGRLDAIDALVLRYRMTWKAARMKHIKKMLLATLKVKAAGFFSLGIRPAFADIPRFIAEALLLLLPSPLLRRLYLRFTFGPGKNLVL